MNSRDRALRTIIIYYIYLQMEGFVSITFAIFELMKLIEFSCFFRIMIRRNVDIYGTVWAALMLSQAGMRLDYKNFAHSKNCSVLTNRIVKKDSF